jgi:outer membrane protein OmpA-like peptidoglycan-associated protein
MKVLKNLILVLFLISSLSLKAQNLISNPDYSDITVEYNNGKQVHPKDWKFLNYYLGFYHSEKNEEDFRQNNRQKSQGVVKLRMLQSNNGITTKLNKRLDVGKSYDIEIEMKIERVMVNFEYAKALGRPAHYMDETLLDSANYDYNYPVSLVTYFSAKELSKDMKERNFVIFDLPEDASPNSPGWFDFHQTYTARGDEEYFSIGSFSTEDYINILRTVKNDTIDYYHKYAEYLFRNVSIFPINDGIVPINGNGDDALTTIADRFDLDSSLVTTPNHKFIIRRVNFELSSFELSDSTKQEINKIALFMRKNSKFNLKITGHTDSIGTKPYNQILSEKRAEAVCQYLVSLGIEKSRLTSTGKGEEQPLDEKLLKKNFCLNRRVEFEFSSGQQ